MIANLLQPYWSFLLDKLGIAGVFVGLVGLALGAAIAIALVLLVLSSPVLIKKRIKRHKRKKLRSNCIEELNAAKTRGDNAAILAAAKKLETVAEKSDYYELGCIFVKAADEKYRSKGIGYLRTLAKENDSGAQYEMVKLLLDGTEGETPTEGIHYLRILAKAKYKDAADILNDMVSRQNSEIEMAHKALMLYLYDTAFERYLPLAKWGNTTAQMIIGHMTSDGMGTSADDEKALFWYMQAANQGDPEAYKSIAELYEKKQMYAEAQQWLKKGADNKKKRT